MFETDNTILSALSPADRSLVAPLLERVELKQGETLFTPHDLAGNAYFFEGGLASEIAIGEGSDRIEIGCVGREGFSPVSLLFEVDRPQHQTIMQVGGAARCIEASDLAWAIKQSETLRTTLLRYAYVFLLQIASTTLAAGRYSVEKRLARWLLMCSDRLGDDLNVTHDFLAMMLGVRRPSVTDALHLLEGKHALKAERNFIKVRSRQKLMEIASASYGVAEAEYRRLIMPGLPEQQ